MYDLLCLLWQKYQKILNWTCLTQSYSRAVGGARVRYFLDLEKKKIRTLQKKKKRSQLLTDVWGISLALLIKASLREK